MVAVLIPLASRECKLMAREFPTLGLGLRSSMCDRYCPQLWIIIRVAMFIYLRVWGSRGYRSQRNTLDYFVRAFGRECVFWGPCKLSNWWPWWPPALPCVGNTIFPHLHLRAHRSSIQFAVRGLIFGKYLLFPRFLPKLDEWSLGLETDTARPPSNRPPSDTTP